MNEPNTHLKIDHTLCGRVTKLKESYAEVVLYTTQRMSVDTNGLVHGGFIFGAADYAAMMAINDPLVVLGSSTSRFLAPVKVGDVLSFKANVLHRKGRKAEVEVVAFLKEKSVFKGTFTTFILEQHPLD